VLWPEPCLALSQKSSADKEQCAGETGHRPNLCDRPACAIRNRYEHNPALLANQPASGLAEKIIDSLTQKG
jgi:hypothetical protein